MPDGSPVSGRIREIRRTLGMSQETLAEAAGLSVTTIKKAESGVRGEVTGATLRRIAAALDVSTVALYTTGAPIPSPTDEGADRALAELRAVIIPPVGINGVALAADVNGPLDLAQVEAATQRGYAAYRADRYALVAEELPGVIRLAHRAVGEIGTPASYGARARALQLVGSYLAQIRQMDLAIMVLQASVRDAVIAEDRIRAALGVHEQGWALTRGGRLAEAERLYTVTADEIEPRMSNATRDDLAVWGKLLLGAAAAAVRINQPGRAREMLTLARSAAAVLGPDRVADHVRWGSFGTSTMVAREAQHALVEDRPDTALELAAPLRSRGGMSPGAWHRLRLDRAAALVLTRDVDRGTGLLRELRLEAPEWLRRQRLAHTVMQAIMDARPRTLTAEQRALATLLRVDPLENSHFPD